MKDRLLENKSDEEYTTLKYLYMYLQNMEQMEELKYILAYMAKTNAQVPVLEYNYNEEKQYIFEGILFSAMTLYTNGSASRSKVAESHKNGKKK